MKKNNRYYLRRLNLVDRISKELNKNSFSIVLKSNSLSVRSNDTEYDFRQNSNFYYLTGITFQDQCYFLINVFESKIEEIIYIEEPNEKKLIWGEQIYHTDNLSKDEYTVDLIKPLIEDKIYKTIMFDTENNMIFMDSSHIALEGNWSFGDISYYLKEMRAIKDEYEVECIKKAISITKTAFNNVKSNIKVGLFEYNVKAEIEFAYLSNNVPLSFQTIAASGINATILHYMSNKDLLKSNNLILIDTGCEYNMYASDITRTIPINGKRTIEQDVINDLSVDASEYILSLIKAGALLSNLQKAYEKYIHVHLQELKIISLDFKLEDIKKITKHKISHHLGIDVHDVVLYKDKSGIETPLKKNNVITLEPGIYFNDKSIIIDDRYYGIGIRLENDILVLDDKSENLSLDI